MSVGHKIIFNGHDLSELIVITSFNKGIRLGRTSNYQNRRGRKGVDHLGYSSDLVTFTMEFVFQPDVENVRSRLTEVLNVTQPKELKVNTESGIIYYAIPQGNIEPDEQSPFGDGVIIWEIPDGVSYSDTEYLFTNEDRPGTWSDEIVVHNLGNEPMNLDLEAEFSSDNGFLLLEGEETYTLFGSIEEADLESYGVSEVLFDDRMWQSRGWSLNNGKVPPMTAAPRQEGTVGYRVESTGEGYAYPTSYAAAYPTDWSGPSLTKTIPASSDSTYPTNWQADIRLDFNPDGAGSTTNKKMGHSSVTFTDQNGAIIVAILFEDLWESSGKAQMAVYIRNKRVYSASNNNPQWYHFNNTPASKNKIIIEKLDGRIQVNLVRKDSRYSQYLSFPFTELGVELRKVTWYAARYKGYQTMTNNVLRSLRVTRLFVQKWRDIPNKFKNGDVLAYGKRERNVYCTLNNKNEFRLRRQGSTLITVPPGKSVISLSYSSFSNRPRVTLRGRARYTI